MTDALYGPEGFYRRPGAPAAHFRTAAHASPLWARAVRELAQRVDATLGSPADFSLVDVGAGGGELLREIAREAPKRWRLVGVDLAPRPEGLCDRIEWCKTPPAEVVGLVLAVELLDVVAVDVVEQTDDGPRLVEVDEDGAERLGDPPSPTDIEWLARWWPLADEGDRAEIGRPRDELWAAVVGTVSRGVAVAVDYAADPRRDVAGTLTGYREGRQVVPAPDGSCDITAHVLLSSCAAAAGGEATLLSQREALLSLGLSGARPSYDGDPAGYVVALSDASEAAELLDPSGLGGFSWLVQPRGIPTPVTVSARA